MVEVLNPNFVSGLSDWTINDATHISCFFSGAVKLSDVNSFVEQNVSLDPGAEYSVSFQYHPSGCGAAPGYGSYPYALAVHLGDDSAIISGYYAPWTAWFSMREFEVTLNPSTTGSLKYEIPFGMPNGVIDSIKVIRREQARVSYVWGLDLSHSLQGAGGVGGLLATVREGNTFYSTYDANGNVSEYVSGSGAIVAHYEYEPFGKETVATGLSADDFLFRFSTKKLEPEADIYYYGYRFYSPQLGRWLNRDPIGERGGINLYGFVENDSVNKWDYLGHYTLQQALASLGGCNSSSGRGQTRCIEFARERFTDQQVFDEWYRLEGTQGSWWTSLPKCPKKLCVGKRDGRGPNRDWAKNSFAKDPSQWHQPGKPSSAELNLHPGTVWSMRSKATGAGHANQCTYDRDGLLLREPTGAGTVDWYRAGTLAHVYHDVWPIYLANSLDGGAHMSLISSTIRGGPAILSSPGNNLRKYYDVRPLWAESP